MQRRPRVAILGAGPTGLDAALACADRGLPFTVYEAADTPAGNVREWGHVRLFTPWSMNVSPRMRRRLTADGTPAPDGEGYPTGTELAERVLDPVARSEDVSPSLRLGTTVKGIGRRGLTKDQEIGTAERSARPFRLLLEDARGESSEEADAVLDCTGVWGNPNSLGDGGIPAVGENALGGRIERSLPDVTADPRRWAGRTVLLAGAGHSAQTAARDLARLAREAPGTEVVWAVRQDEPDWDAVRGDPLPERAALVAEAEALRRGGSAAVTVHTASVVEALRPEGGRVAVTLRNGGDRDLVVDEVVSLTGSVGDNRLYRQLQVHECYATCGPMSLSAALLGSDSADCLTQESHGADALRLPEPNFFLLGSKSHGRYGLYLMRIGFEQVDDAMGLLGY